MRNSAIGHALFAVLVSFFSASCGRPPSAPKRSGQSAIHPNTTSPGQNAAAPNAAGTPDPQKGADIELATQKSDENPKDSNAPSKAGTTAATGAAASTPAPTASPVASATPVATQIAAASVASPSPTPKAMPTVLPSPSLVEVLTKDVQLFELVNFQANDVTVGTENLSVVRVANLGTDGKLTLNSFDGLEGKYTVKVVVIDEHDGVSNFDVQVNGVKIGKTISLDYYDLGAASDIKKTVEIASDVMLHHGDKISVVARSNADEWVRIEKFIFAPTSP